MGEFTDDKLTDNPANLVEVALSLLVALPGGAAEPPALRFPPQTIDPPIQIRYGLAIADVDGDAKPEVVVVALDRPETNQQEPPARLHVLNATDGQTIWSARPVMAPSSTEPYSGMISGEMPLER